MEIPEQNIPPGADKEKIQSSAVHRSSFTHDVFRLLTNRFLIILISFGSGVVIARSLGADGRGILAALLVYPSMFLSLTEMGVRQSTVFYLGKGIFSEQKIIGAVGSLILLTGISGMLVCGLLIFVIGNPAFKPWMVALAVATIPATIVSNYSAGIFLGKRQVGQFTSINRSAEILRFVAVVALVWFFALGVLGALVATLLSALLVAFFAIKKVSHIASMKPNFDWEVIKALLLKGLLYAIALFVLNLNYKVDIALMERLTSVSEIGVYSIAVGIAQLLWTLPTSLTPALLSHTATESDELGFSRKVARLFRVTLVVSFLGLLFLAATAPIVIPFVYGAEFRSSVSALQLLLPGIVCFGAFKVLYSNLAGRGHPNISLLATIPSLLLNMSLNWFLLPRYGAKGAAIASSISYSLACLGMMILFTRKTGVTLRELCKFQRSDLDFLRFGLRKLKGKKSL